MIQETIFHINRINDGETVRLLVKGSYWIGWILILIIPIMILLCTTCKIRRRLIERSFMKTMNLLTTAKDYLTDIYIPNYYKPVTDKMLDV